MSIRKKVKKVLKAPSEVRVFLNDFLRYKKYSSSCNEKMRNCEYCAIYYAHSLEKGMSITSKMRPFGYDKVKLLSKYIDRLIELRDTESFAYNMGISTLFAYKKHYETNSYTDRVEYLFVKKYLECKNKPLIAEGGAMKYVPITKVDKYIDFIKNRHSTRSYETSNIDSEIKYATECAIFSPSACNRQMIRVYYFSRATRGQKEIIKYAKGIGGFNKATVNFAVITADLCSTLNEYERNQGPFNAGLFSMNFVNALHEKGVGSCFIQFANKPREEKKLKAFLGIPANEQIVVLIACGKYEKEYLVPKSSRRKMDEVLRIV